MELRTALTGICRQFGIIPDSTPEILGTGHINSTYRLTSGGTDYVLQSLNPSVFTRPEAVMSNIAAVQKAFSRRDRTDVNIPEYLSAGDRNYVTADGKLWRMYRFISPENTGGCREHLAGLAFGSFIRTVSGITVSGAVEGYHDFHGYISRLASLPYNGSPELFGKLISLGKTIDEVFAPLPRRVIHGDAKLGNVITGTKCTVIDLDTVMNGYAAIDFGDLIRSLGTLDTDSIRAAAEGFAEGLDGLLSDAEVGSLCCGIFWVTGELAARYLIDYITGEGYFSDKTQEQRLERARELAEQLRTLMSMENDIKHIIRSIWR